MTDKTDGQLQYELTKKLNFNRMGGTDEELKAANILKEEVESIGGSAVLEEFQITHYEVYEASLTVLEPFEREIQVTAVGRTGSTHPDGIVAPFQYIEQGEEMDFYDTDGKIVMLNSLTLDVYKRLCKSRAAGFLLFSGSFIDDDEKTDLEKRYIRDRFLEHGRIPGVTMRTKDAIELVRDGAAKVKMTVRQSDVRLTSRNVVATLKGTQYPDEIVSFTAHYDSVCFSSGAWDNASGSADIMALYRHFYQNPPKRTLKFIWCGSEELGLLGSKAYTEAHKDELAQYKFGINIDMTGPVLGNDIAVYTADASMQAFMEYLARERRHSIKISQGVYSSDSTPFSDHGVPTISFHRSGQAAVHNRNDIIMPLWGPAMAKTLRFITAFAERIINAEIVPVPREIPQNMKDEIDKYYKRK